MAERQDLTDLLQAWGRGEREAAERLLPLVYDELRRQAARQVRRERRNHTLRPTALVHEAYLRLARQREGAWHDRTHFFAAAAQVMRRILVDHARRHRAGKRGGGWCRVSLDEAAQRPAQEPRVDDVDLIVLEDALTELAELDPPKAKMVELRFFGGLGIDETAEVLGVSPSTVSREWG